MVRRSLRVFEFLTSDVLIGVGNDCVREVECGKILFPFWFG